MLRGKRFRLSHTLCVLLELDSNIITGEEFEEAFELYCTRHDLWNDKTLKCIFTNQELFEHLDTKRHILFLDDIYHLLLPHMTFFY
jgi:hypothetical protein